MREKLIDVFCAVLGADPDYRNEEAIQFVDELIANGVTVQKWIPVTERLPEERDSFFAKFYGTERWADGMFLKISKEILTCVEYTDGTIAVKALHTTDGKWHLGFHQAKVTHWMPLPEPLKGE